MSRFLSTIMLAAMLVGCGGSPTTSTPTPTVAAILLSPTTASLVPAATLQLTATAKDAAGNVVSGQTISWSTSAATVATVSSTGLVAAVAIGSATITAGIGTTTATATITVQAGAVIGAAGGTATSADANVSVVIPAGALTQPTNITVVPTTINPASALVVAGSAYDLGPSGTQFLQPVTVTIKYDPTKVRAGVPPQVLGLYTAGATSWSVTAGSTVDTVAHTVQGTSTHFTAFSVSAPGLLLTVDDPDRIQGESLIQAELTLCVSPGASYSIPLRFLVLDPNIPSSTPSVISSKPDVANGSGTALQLDVLAKMPGSATLTVEYANVAIFLTVTVTTTTPPCYLAGQAYTFYVGGSDQVQEWSGSIRSLVANPASYPAVRPAWTGAYPGIAFQQTQGATTLLRYLYVAGAGQPITLASTTGTFWGESFVDGTYLVFSEEPTSTPNKAELFKIARDGTGRTQLTNLGQYMGPSAAAQNGKIYVAWATDRNQPTQIVELSAQGTILRTFNGAGLYLWRPAVSQNSRWLAYERYTADFSSEQIFVMDLKNPTDPPVAASPAVGSGLSSSWCGNDYLYFVYTTAPFEGPPYQVMRWSRATGTSAAVPLLAGYNTPQLAIEPTWGVKAPLLCP